MRGSVKEAGRRVFNGERKIDTESRLEVEIVYCI